MAVVFEGEVKVTLNRHGFLGDGIVLHFPDGVCVFQNTSSKYTVQINYGPNIGTDFGSVTDGYIAAQVHLGKLQLKDGQYVPVNG